MKRLIIFLLLSLSINTWGESALENYLQLALENNLVLSQKEFDLGVALNNLDKARTMFFPTITLTARYTWASGGRTIDFPVGQLLNPLYQIHGIPSVEDQSISLIPALEQQTGIQIIQPVFVPRLVYNYRLYSGLVQTKQLELLLFIRYLIAEVKQSYFNYLKALKVMDVYRHTEDVLKENLRISQKLFASGVATEEVVFRAEAEIALIEQTKTLAEKNLNLAAAYFNYLLNRPYNTQIETFATVLPTFDPGLTLEKVQQAALSRREEIKLYQNFLKMQDDSVSLARSGYIPEVMFVFEYGYQGEDYVFTTDRDYVTASLVLKWKIFDSLQTNAEIEQARKLKRKLLKEFEDVQEQIKLEVYDAWESLAVAKKTIISAEEGYQSMSKYFEIIAKKYEHGMSTQIEYMDAQTKMTNAEINRHVVGYNYLIEFSHFEYVTASLLSTEKEKTDES